LYSHDITYAQFNLLDSHDTPRFLSCASGNMEALKLAWLFLLCYPGAPCIFYGDEIGIDGEHDPGCRKSFPWEENRWNKNLRTYLKEIIALRKQNPALRGGDFTRLWSANGTYVFSRSLDKNTLVIALNTSESPQQVEVTSDSKRSPKVLVGEATDIAVIENRLKFRIPARCGVVLK